MKSFYELGTLPNHGDVIKFNKVDAAVECKSYSYINSVNGDNILDEPNQTYTVLSVNYDIIKANGNKTGNTFTMNDVHWRPIKDTTPIDWSVKKRVYRDYKKSKNVSQVARDYDISRRSVGRIVSDLESTNVFTRWAIRLGLR